MFWANAMLALAAVARVNSTIFFMLVPLGWLANTLDSVGTVRSVRRRTHLGTGVLLVVLSSLALQQAGAPHGCHLLERRAGIGKHGALPCQPEPGTGVVRGVRVRLGVAHALQPGVHAGILGRVAALDPRQ